MTNVTYSERLSYYDTKEGLKLLERIAEARGLTMTAALRQLVREEIKRLDREERQ
jgi:hypothetical protein